MTALHHAGRGAGKHHVFFRGFNPQLLLPKMFWMIFCLLLQTFRKCWCLKKFDEGKCCFRPSIGITKTKFELQPHIVLQHNILSKMHFLIKDSYAKYLLNSTSKTYLALLIYDLHWKGIFGGFLELTNTLALMKKRKLQKPPKITHRGNYHSSTPRKAKMVPKVLLER